MQTNTYLMTCETTPSVMGELIARWWKSVDHPMKAVLVDGLPRRFEVRFRLGDPDLPFDQFSVFVRIKTRVRSGRTVSKIEVTYSEWAKFGPIETLREIVRWFDSALKARNVRFEMGPGLFQKRVDRG